MTAIVVQLPGCEKSYAAAAEKASSSTSATDEVPKPEGVAGRRRKREEMAAQQQQMAGGETHLNYAGGSPYGVSAPEWKRPRAAQDFAS